MEKADTYSINYQGLSQGEHLFEFELGSKFFANFATEEISNGQCKVSIVLTKSSNLLSLQTNIEGKVEVICDRCLDGFYTPVNFDGKLTIKFSTTNQGYDTSRISNFDDEILWVDPTDSTELELSQYLYESIFLSLPARRVHPLSNTGETMCNLDMLTRFIVAPDNNDEEDDQEEGNYQSNEEDEE